MCLTYQTYCIDFQGEIPVLNAWGVSMRHIILLFWSTPPPPPSLSSCFPLARFGFVPFVELSPGVAALPDKEAGMGMDIK